MSKPKFDDPIELSFILLTGLLFLVGFLSMYIAVIDHSLVFGCDFGTEIMCKDFSGNEIKDSVCLCANSYTDNEVMWLFMFFGIVSIFLAAYTNHFRKFEFWSKQDE